MLSPFIYCTCMQTKILPSNTTDMIIFSALLPISAPFE